MEFQKKEGKKKINTMKNDDDEFLISILEQNWLHLRHVENQRMWFTNIYVIIVAGSLTFIGSQPMSFFSSYFAFARAQAHLK